MRLPFQAGPGARGCKALFSAGVTTAPLKLIYPAQPDQACRTNKQRITSTHFINTYYYIRSKIDYFHISDKIRSAIDHCINYAHAVVHDEEHHLTRKVILYCALEVATFYMTALPAQSPRKINKLEFTRHVCVNVSRRLKQAKITAIGLDVWHEVANLVNSLERSTPLLKSQSGKQTTNYILSMDALDNRWKAKPVAKTSNFGLTMDSIYYDKVTEQDNLSQIKRPCYRLDGRVEPKELIKDMSPVTDSEQGDGHKIMSFSTGTVLPSYLMDMPETV